MEQEAWKKKLNDEVERIQQQYPDADVEIWCEDEHRIGLHPVMRRVWVEAGETPIAIVNWKREWLQYCSDKFSLALLDGLDSAFFREPN